MVDGNGRGLVFHYNAAGLLQSVQDAHGRSHTFTYGSFADEYWLDPMWARQWQMLTQIQVTGPGTPNTGYQWQFDYGTPLQDSLYYNGTYTGDLVIRKQEPSGKLIHYRYVGVDPDPAQPTHWDGQVWETWYADQGITRKITRQGTTLIYPGDVAYTYGYAGHTVSSIREEATGREVHYRYDALNNLTALWTNQETETNPLVRFDHQLFPGSYRIQKTTATNVLGDVVETQFGLYNLPITTLAQRRQQGGQLYDQLTRFYYDGAPAPVPGQPNNVTRVERGTLADVWDAVQFTYGAMNAPDQPTSATDLAERTWTYAYHAVSGLLAQSGSPENAMLAAGHADRARSVTVLSYHSDGLPFEITDPVGRVYRLTYAADAADIRCLRVTLQNVAANSSRSVVLDADGRVVKVINEEGVTTRYTYNLSGLLVSVTEDEGGPKQRTTSYQYNLQGDLIRLIPPKGLGSAVEFDYRRFTPLGVLVGGELYSIYEGQTTRIQHPDGSLELFGYDAGGNLAWISRGSVTAPGQVRIDYERDALHRVTNVHYPASLQGVPGFTVTYVYDEFGRVRQERQPDGSVTDYVYDPLDRVVKVTPGDGRKELTREYVADTVKRRWHTRTWLAGIPQPWVEWDDSKGRVQQVSDPTGQQFWFDYYPDGQVQARSYLASGAANFVTDSTYEYHPDGRLKVLRHFKLNGALIDQFSYAYHQPSGRLWKETDAGNRVHEFRYDRLGRLTEEYYPDLGANGNYYEYDVHDNRILARFNNNVDYYMYDAADKLQWYNRNPGTPYAGPSPNQARVYGIYQYDDLGQLIYRDRRLKKDGTRQQHHLMWDTAGRLREGKRGTNAAFNATYTADGQRVSKWDSESGQHLDSYGLFDANGNTHYLPGLSSVTSSGVYRKFHEDWLGSTRYFHNSVSGNTPTAQRYDAFGNRSARGGNSPSSYPSPYQFAGVWGYQTEPDTGHGLDLMYLYQRYYEPDTGRFISRDPIRWAGGLNLYGYAGGDPVNFVDPLGLAPSPPSKDPWGRPIPPGVKGHYHPADAGHPLDHYDYRLKVGGGTRDYRYYPHENLWQEKGNDKYMLNDLKNQGSNNSYLRTRRRLCQIRETFIKLQRKEGNHNPEFKRRPGLRLDAREWTGRSSGSGGALGAIATIGYGVGAGAEGATHALRWRRRIEQAYDEVTP